jgi:NSS family neurotransmitter:Na+ symporter
MSEFDFSKRDSFGSKFGAIAAAAGSAIGLGNIWRFPYLLGENGGAAFLFIYLGFIFAIGIPVMLSEFVIGRSTQRNPYGAFKILAPKKHWYLVGLMGVVAAFMILAFYTAVSGWTLEYLYQSIINGFSGKQTSELGQMFDSFKESTFRPILWFVLFMIMTTWIVISGVKDGIEKYTKVLMPLLIVLLIVLCIRTMTLPGAADGLRFIFKPDFSKVTTYTILQALGQVFFSLSIGMGTLITYGSYMNKKDNLATTAVSVSLSDTLVAMLAGIAIFPAVFAFGIEPTEGPGLVFKTLPNIFQQMSGGYVFSLVFFTLLAVAALTSTISVLEVIVAYFSEELKMTRKRATIIASASVSILGIASVMSWGPLANVKLFDKNIFDILEFTSANILLPLGGLLIVGFIGWFYGYQKTKNELSNNSTLKARYIPLYMFIIKFIAPIAIAIVFLNGIGLINL